MSSGEKARLSLELDAKSIANAISHLVRERKKLARGASAVVHERKRMAARDSHGTSCRALGNA
jgi:hypothetical protein